MIASALLLIFSPKLYAGEFKWKVEVLNIKTREVRTFLPTDADFDIDLPKPTGVSCTLTKPWIEKEKGLTRETRHLWCRTERYNFSASPQCVRTSSTMNNFPQGLAIADKKSDTSLSINVECE